MVSSPSTPSTPSKVTKSIADNGNRMRNLLSPSSGQRQRQPSDSSAAASSAARPKVTKTIANRGNRMKNLLSPSAGQRQSSLPSYASTSSPARSKNSLGDRVKALLSSSTKTSANPPRIRSPSPTAIPPTALPNSTAGSTILVHRERSHSRPGYESGDRMLSLLSPSKQPRSAAEAPIEKLAAASSDKQVLGADPSSLRTAGTTSTARADALVFGSTAVDAGRGKGMTYSQGRGEQMRYLLSPSKPEQPILVPVDAPIDSTKSDPAILPVAGAPSVPMEKGISGNGCKTPVTVIKELVEASADEFTSAGAALGVNLSTSRGHPHHSLLLLT